MKIERVNELFIEKPYATLTITATEYDTIRNALKWAENSTDIDVSRYSFRPRFQKLYHEMANARL